MSCGDIDLTCMLLQWEGIWQRHGHAVLDVIDKNFKSMTMRYQ